MSHFIHCNQCFCRPNKELQIFLTSCGHLFCARCCETEPVANGTCAVCKQPKIAKTLLCGTMKYETQEYFMDMSHFFKKMTKVHLFQKFHTQRYVSHLEIEAKKLKAENIRYEKKVVQMDKVLKSGSMGQFGSQSQRPQSVAQPQSASHFRTSQMQRQENMSRGYGQYASQPASMMQRFQPRQQQMDTQMLNKLRLDDVSVKSEYYTPRSSGSSQMYQGLIGSQPNASRISLGPRSTSNQIYGMFRRPIGTPSSGEKEVSMSSYSSRTPRMMVDSFLKKRATVSPYGR